VFQCLFPREVVKHIVNPVFVLNPAYDAWQVPSSYPSYFRLSYFCVKNISFNMLILEDLCFRYNMHWLQNHLTLNIHGCTVDWILASAALNNLKFSKVDSPSIRHFLFHLSSSLRPEFMVMFCHAQYKNLQVSGKNCMTL
jgi:hypothetical protein